MSSDTGIEQVLDLPENMKIKHVICDHDGTISTLREGWQPVMEKMMFDSIVTEKAISAGKKDEILTEIREYIRESTGVQTLVQMHRLVELVEKYGCSDRTKILTAAEYKEVYNDLLFKHIAQRHEALHTRNKKPDEFMIEDVQRFLMQLQASDCTLYLASGTDERDVVMEAELMGYADLFRGGIYGSRNDVNFEVKRAVMRRIVERIRVCGETNLLVIGDGPVEIREARDHGAVAIGIASDEIRRSGINRVKRDVLIAAGAHLIIGDYRQTCELLELLKIS